MDISEKIISTHYQKRLFPELLGNHGHRRVVIGNFIEFITMKLFNGQKHKCSNGKYCPDISVGGIYLECKAMGRSNSTLIYRGRLLKDKKFAKSHKLYYVIWSHTTDTIIPETVYELQCSVLANLKWCAVIPFQKMFDICNMVRLTELNSKYGNSHDSLYNSGYRVPARLIEQYKLIDVNL